jgi:hypothetical protein
MVFGHSPTTMGATWSFVLPFRVIRVHTRMGEVDKGVSRIRAIASVDLGTGTSVALALTSILAYCHEARAGWSTRALPRVGLTHA